jgi:intracellular multiplication protein IcmL
MQTKTYPEESNNATVAHLRDNFYRDGFHLVWLSIALIITEIVLLIIVSLYFFLHQVLPINFSVYEGFRVQPDVPVDKPYVHIPDLLQWVSTAMPEVFNTDFINYNQKLQNIAHYFTTDGWAKYVNVVNVFMSHNDIVQNKQFVSAVASGAPVVLNEGIVDGKYAWWVQMPINVRYSNVDGQVHSQKLMTQTLVIRVPTLNNLEGIAIENLIVSRA